MRFCGVVVFYKPDKDVFKNIETYINNIEKLYIIDNSELSNERELKEKLYYKKCVYIHMQNKVGLAAALNKGCYFALRDGYDYCLTMDQDSSFDEDGAKYLIEYAKMKPTSLICSNARAVYSVRGLEQTSYIEYNRNTINEINWTMTSGTLMNLHIFQKNGGFDESMFIGHIDIEYAIRNRLAGNICVVIGKAILKQKFGNSQPRRILWKRVHPSFADPVRSYYIFRNQIYIYKKYGFQTHSFINVNLWKFVVKMILFEPNKVLRAKMMIKGLEDGYKGNMGAYGRLEQR